MALLYMDSFSHASDFSTKGWFTTAQPLYTQATGRHGYCAAGYNRTMQRYIPSSANPIIIGFAFRPTTMNSWNNMLIIREGTTNQQRIGWNDNGQLIINHGNGNNLATTTGLLTINAWSYLEFKVKFHDTSGGVWVRQNNVSIVRIGDYAQTPVSLDTLNGGSGSVDNVYFGYDGSSNLGFDFQDFVILDTTGSANNDFLGDVRVDAIFPNGNGNSSQWVGSDGNSTDNYALVDETSPATADYVQSTTVDNKDTYTFGDLTSTAGSVYGVQILPYIAKADAGPRSIKTVARLSSTETDGPTRALSNSASYLFDVRETKPGGGSWSISDVNSAEFGVKVATPA